MRIIKRQGMFFLATAACAAATFGPAQANLPTLRNHGTANPFFHADRTAGNAERTHALPRLASRDMAERYYQAYRLIGSHVLNFDGKRIGQVSSVVLDDRGDLKQMLIGLADTSDADGGSIAISPHRAEVVSTRDASVTVIRIDLSREEIIQAQFTSLKSDARAPAPREAGPPDLHRDFGPLY